MIYLKTENCVVCGRKAAIWFGHVRKGEEKVLAGWCALHKIHHASFHGDGYRGSYIAEKHGRCIPFCDLED